MKGIFFIFLIFPLMSCDDGKIYEESVVIASEGRVLSMSGRITGIDSWPDGYSIVVAGFG